MSEVVNTGRLFFLANDAALGDEAAKRRFADAVTPEVVIALIKHSKRLQVGLRDAVSMTYVHASAHDSAFYIERDNLIDLAEKEPETT